MFTQEYLEQLESILGTEWVKTANNIEDKVLYEIQRLQRDNEFIASQRDRALEQAFEMGHEQRVYCTADGEYPEHRQEILLQVGSIIATGIFTIQKQLFGREEQIFVTNKNFAFYHEDDNPIYWKPLISLELQYAQQALKEVTK